VTVNLRNTSGEPRDLPGGRTVDVDEVLEVAGDVSKDSGDAYLIGKGDDARAWPKAHWTAEGEPKKRRTTSEEKA
jgi:hypothetical protein